MSAGATGFLCACWLVARAIAPKFPLEWDESQTQANFLQYNRNWTTIPTRPTQWLPKPAAVTAKQKCIESITPKWEDGCATFLDLGISRTRKTDNFLVAASNGATWAFGGGLPMGSGVLGNPRPNSGPMTSFAQTIGGSSQPATPLDLS